MPLTRLGLIEYARSHNIKKKLRPDERAVYATLHIQDAVGNSSLKVLGTSVDDEGIFLFALPSEHKSPQPTQAQIEMLKAVMEQQDEPKLYERTD